MTTKTEKLIDFYKAFLESIDVIENKEGILTHENTGVPVFVDDKAMALPTRDNLKRMKQDNLVIYHPLSENVFNGISETMIATRDMAMLKLFKMISVSAHVLLKLAADPARHSELTDSQADLISKLAGTDEKLVKNFAKFVSNVYTDKNNRLVNLFIKNGGSIGDEKFSRTTHVSFPAIEKLYETEGEISGVTFRKKDLPILQKLFEIVLPKATQVDAYSAGSSSNVAPYFASLIKACAKMFHELGGITWKFRSYIQDEIGETIHVTADKIEQLLSEGDSWKSLANAVPALPYNTGHPPSGDKTEHNYETLATTRLQEENIVEKKPRELRRAQEDRHDESPREIISDVLNSSRRDTVQTRVAPRESYRTEPRSRTSTRLMDSLPRSGVTRSAPREQRHEPRYDRRDRYQEPREEHRRGSHRLIDNLPRR